MLAPVLIRKLKLCFSTVSINPGALLLLWWSEEPVWEALGPVTGWEALASIPLGPRDSVPSNVFLDKWGRVPEVVFSGGTPC
jgi:hypothetical protein